MESFSLRDATRAFGVTANATYRDFDSKSALAAVAGSASDDFACRMQRKLMLIED